MSRRLLLIEEEFNLLRLTFLMGKYEEKSAVCQEKIDEILCTCQWSVSVLLSESGSERKHLRLLRRASIYFDHFSIVPTSVYRVL
jgi:hypothetical protein